MGIAPSHLSFHVLEDDNPADALLDYVRINQVEQIVIGASLFKEGLGHSLVLRPLLGSDSSRVVLEAPCSVTVVRPRNNDEN
ncbi:MAG: universal stress protein [Georgfuchsia sp.]